ncbi:hypothetical protein Ahy_A05g021956 isoform B [Arachis hypogaea]|uniref:SLH domain-containing protein n=1 Tax=Arachis hypogaea TaxID=3818 RepID=A0A445CZ55_ARAHY|nr:hypothetical protein Ahy_A05g021956 isoform B [Arachis hypogaea]
MMAMVTATSSSPSSLQLRLAFNAANCRRFPFTLRFRTLNFNPRLRLFCVAETGNGSDKASWTGSDPKGDGFSGWSDSDAADQPDKKESFGGVVGVGVAGVLLLTGLTFAALSLNKRVGSRPEQQMKPLTAHQETLLSSDDRNSEQVNASIKVEQGNGNTEGSQLVENTRNTSDGIDADDATKPISVLEDLEQESSYDDKLDIPTENATPLNFSESESTFAAINTYESIDSKPVVDSAETIIEVKENQFNVEPGNTLDDDAKWLHLNTEQQDEITNPSGSRGSSISNKSVADNETETVSVTVNPESNSIVSVPEFSPRDDQENALSTSAKENIDLKKTQDSADGNKSSLEEKGIPGNDVRRNDNDEVRARSLFSAPGIPAPTVVSAASQMLPGKVLVPAAVDQVQGQALAALQVLKVIEPDVQPSHLCTRREYARWLVTASSALSRNTISKVYPAMYIDNVTELAFDDITPEDPDFSSIQGLAEAGLIESKLSRHDIQLSADEDGGPFYFSPESPLSRQDLVSWKMALEKRQLPEADRKTLYKLSGFIDTEKIHPNACPALVADLSAGEQGIIALAFEKPVTNAQAAVALATGDASDVVSEELARIEAESMAENAVAAHSALVAQVERDINANFEQELLIEREKINNVEKMAEEAKLELERLRAERENENIALLKERAAIESEMEVFSRLRREVEDQLQSLMNNKVEIAYEKERINKLREEAEVENKEIARLQYELEVERKALSMARAWAEDEAKRVREQAKALEEARDRWERHGIKVVVDNDLREEASPGVTWLNAGEQFSVQGTVNRAGSLLDKLKKMAADVRGKSRETIDKIINVISIFISNLREWACKTRKQAEELGEATISKAGKSAHELQQGAVEFGYAVKEGAKRVAGDCREGVEKLTQKFIKT